MKKTILLALIFILPLFQLIQAQTSSRVQISLDQQSLQTLTNMGIPVDEGIDRDRKSLITDLYDDEIQRIIESGVQVETIIPDVASFYKNRYLESVNNPDFQEILSTQNLIYQVPQHFYLGSMGGFYTWQQIQNQLDSMALLYPDLVKAKQPVSSTMSIENRPVNWLKISDNPNVDEEEPELLYTGVHHAREPIGVQQLLFYMWYLLENYNSNPIISYIVNNTEMYFVPVINPDGYVYNQTTNPQGGGNWRKNRRNTGSAFGIDINRNYGYMWGLDDIGSSPDPNEETYRGAAAFSEPETQNMRDFCNARHFKICLNYHSYANKLLYAWGYDDVNALTVDDTIFSAYAKLLTRENHYLYGPGATTIYMTNGGSDDWMYGEQTTKAKILAYTAEVGSNDDGFWPAPENIIPLCRQNMWQNLNAALLCLQYATVEDRTSFNLPDIYGNLYYDIQKLGMESPASFVVSVEPVSNNIIAVGSPVQYSNLQYMETRRDSVYYQLVPDIEVGDEVKYLLRISNGTISFADTITKIYGTVFNISYDSCNQITNWTGNWSVTNSDYHSATGSITDSPDATYNSFENNSITTTQSINLPASSMLFLSFWAKWALEPDFDYVQVKISTNNGNSWTPLSGPHTELGTSNQAFNEPLYDGSMSGWVEEQIDISSYAGNNVKFRFTLMSDNFVEMDGFYFDDFRVITLSPGTGIPENSNGIHVSGPIPNPANDQCKLYFNSRDHSDLTLEVCNAEGKLVYGKTVSSQSGEIGFSIKGWNAGIYYCKLSQHGTRTVTRKLIVIPD